MELTNGEATMDSEECTAHSPQTDEWCCDWYTCSSCKESNIYPDANYCPDCGAKIATKVAVLPTQPAGR